MLCARTHKYFLSRKWADSVTQNIEFKLGHHSPHREDSSPIQHAVHYWLWATMTSVKSDCFQSCWPRTRLFESGLDHIDPKTFIIPKSTILNQSEELFMCHPPPHTHTYPHTHSHTHTHTQISTKNITTQSVQTFATEILVTSVSGWLWGRSFIANRSSGSLTIYIRSFPCQTRTCGTEDRFVTPRTMSAWIPLVIVREERLDYTPVMAKQETRYNIAQILGTKQTVARVQGAICLWTCSTDTGFWMLHYK